MSFSYIGLQNEMPLGTAYIHNDGVYQLSSLDYLLKLNCMGRGVMLSLSCQLHVETKRDIFL